MSDLHVAGQRDGTTFEPKKDQLRLDGQMKRVFDVMSDGQWRVLKHIADVAKAPEASVSARLRDLRKPKFGGYTIERDNLGNGLWAYRMVLPKPTQLALWKEWV